MLSGDNNLLKRAGEAKNKTELESIKEEAKIVMSHRTIEKTTIGTYSKTLKQDLESGISGGQVEEIAKADGTTKYTDVCYVNKNGQSITVYEDGEVAEGKVSIWKGATDIKCPEFKKDETTNVWNWYIYTAGQLKFLADFVNNGNSLNGTENGADLNSYVTEANYDPSTVTMSTDTTIYLMNNLDLGARPGEGDTDEAKWETNPDELKWMPIGIDQNNVKDKLGTFEGNNNTIRGLYINRKSYANGLFGNANGVLNLTISNSYILGQNYTGGIVGVSFGKIENCHNKNTTLNAKENSQLYYIGGIVGCMNVSSTINRCSNTGKIEILKATGIGGIVGCVASSCEITKCTNSGIITKLGEDKINYIGGIVGYAQKTDIIKECNNNGKVIGEIYVGGIVGYAGISSTINDCNNDGTINGERQVGGIVGRAIELSTIMNCKNTSTINGTNSVAGIAGIAGSTVKRCYNTGNIVSNGETGGIVGGCITESGQDINLCYNSGEIKGAGVVGGICGYLGGRNANPAGKEYRCYNKGKIINTNNLTSTGELVGKMWSNASVNNCYYYLNSNIFQGIGEINNGSTIIIATSEHNAGIQSTDVDLKSFEEFLVWIDQQ